MSETVVVVGGGLAGCMTALLLAQRKNERGEPAFSVDVYEKREDFRAKERERDMSSAALGAAADSLKRSINLALSVRGQEALRKAGLLEEVMPNTVRMKQRVMHDESGHLSLQPYGTHGEAIHSVSREDLNRTLLDHLEALPNVRLHFSKKLVSVRVRRDVGNATLTFEDGTVTARCVIGADGAYSRVRDALLRQTRANFSRVFIDHQYKELDMPPKEGGGWSLPLPEGLHIWPRGDHMMIALPNQDGSFTCTLFAPQSIFAHLDHLARESDGALLEWFRTEFPDALAHIPDLAAQYRQNPAGALVTIRCRPWCVGSSLLLVGDAAHAVVPFYGQGMNAAFEDALALDETLDAVGGDLAAAIPRFAAERQPQGDALADLSFANYVEMRAHTANPLFLAQKRVESVLHACFPKWWIPQYTMVAFTRTPYTVARDAGKRQDQALATAATLTAAAAAIGIVAATAIAVSRAGGPKNLWEAIRRYT